MNNHCTRVKTGEVIPFVGMTALLIKKMKKTLFNRKRTFTSPTPEDYTLLWLGRGMGLVCMRVPMKLRATLAGAKLLNGTPKMDSLKVRDRTCDPTSFPFLLSPMVLFSPFVFPVLYCPFLCASSYLRWHANDFRCVPFGSKSPWLSWAVKHRQLSLSQESPYVVQY